MKKIQNSFNSIEFIKQLELILEIEEEKKHLRDELGLSEIEIEGYFECFVENYVDIRRTIDENC